MRPCNSTCPGFPDYHLTGRPDPKPDYRPSQVRFITLAYEGKTSGIWEGWTRLFANVEDPAERKAFYRLLVHCEKYARIDGKLLAPLARYHRAWLRPMEDWYPQSQNKRRQFGALVRHLLARYEVPFFMDGAWRGPDGNLAEGPPLQPHFTMKGRSIDKLLRQVEAWHGDFALDQHVDWEEWSNSGLRGYECEEEDGPLGVTLRWSVRELCDSWALAKEGQAMCHCVKSYARRCAKGGSNCGTVDRARLTLGDSPTIILSVVSGGVLSFRFWSWFLRSRACRRLVGFRRIN